MLFSLRFILGSLGDRLELFSLFSLRRRFLVGDGILYSVEV